MGARYGEAREVARQFIEAMGPNDLMDLMIFSDQQVVHDSKWKSFKERNDLVGVLNQQPGVIPQKSRDRPLFNIIKGMTRDAFRDLGSTTGPQNVPLHQAMVVLSNGSGRGDPASASPSAEIFSQYLNRGRFPEDNTSLPKTPLPVVSIWFPSRGGLQNDIFRNNDAQFMQSLANPEIGGYFNVIREGAAQRGKTIINLVKQRFNAMWIVKWRLSCLNPSVEQSFNLVFENTKPMIAPDATFKDVPIGVDPTQWPLDVDFAKTKAEADANPLYPGGTFKVFGDFCWAGDKSRAEAYFVPAGTKPPPNTNSRDPELAKRAMQQLIAQNMRGAAIDVGDTFASFQVPDDEKILEGSGDAMVARVVLFDNRAKRASAVDEKTVLQLRARKKPFNMLLVLGLAGGAIVILLLVIVVARGGGGGGGRKRGHAPPAPVVAGGQPPYGPPHGGYGGPPHGGYGGPQGGGGYGGPPPGGGYGGPHHGGGGYGGPPPGGGYGAAPSPEHASAQPATPFQAPHPASLRLDVAAGVVAAPRIDAMREPHVAADGGVVQVRCPACGMMTMATPGQPSVCFSCGQPLAADLTAPRDGHVAIDAQGVVGAPKGGGGVVAAPVFPAHGRHGGAAGTAAEPVRLS
jgi:hypothetical protein